jgi:hypothetical protein
LKLIRIRPDWVLFVNWTAYAYWTGLVDGRRRGAVAVSVALLAGTLAGYVLRGAAG